MDIAASSAILNYQAARPGTRPDPNAEQETGTLSSLYRDFSETLKQAEETAQASMVSDVDPHALVQALAQSELAVETVVTVRNKVVEAYQEILRMPV